MTVSTLPPTAVLHHILTRACRAPSVHNSQPWRWRVDGDHVTLLADRTRQLMRTDPEGRDLVLSCGAALHHFRVAAAGEGCRSRVVRKPYGAGDNVLAIVELFPGEPTHHDVAAARAIDRRRTDRRSFSSWPMPHDRLAGLVRAAEDQGASAVAVTDPRRRRRMVQILARAMTEQQLNWTTVDETAAWTGPRATDGVPPQNVPRREDAERHADPVGTRYPSGTLVDDGDDAAEPGYDESRMVVIATRGDETVDRLQAGEALSAVLLEATGQGLASVTLSQATEVHRTRRWLQDEILGGSGVAQVVVRVGWLPVAYEPVPETPRRPLREVLDD